MESRVFRTEIPDKNTPKREREIQKAQKSKEMEMAMKAEKRAERRKRIMSGETDRMALITGQLQTLPPPPPPSPSSPAPFLLQQTHQRVHSHTGIPSSFSKELQKNPDSVPIATFDAISKPKDEKRAIALLKRMSISEVPEVNINAANAAIEHALNHQKLDSIGEVISTEIIKSPSASTTMPPKPHTDNKPLSKTPPSKPKLFTSKRLHACIVASQTTRVFCSLIIASLAVLSHTNRTLFIISNILEIVVGSKPLYILLLTNATIVAARMLAERQKDSREAEEECEKMKEDGHNMDSAMKVLDRGLVSYQALRAISIDLSVYAVVVICGFSVL